MRAEPFRLRASDGAALHVERWIPDTGIRGWLQIVHGMGEHASRYERFARQACAAGLAVAAHDQRGHGQSAGAAVLGEMGAGGWRAALSDVSELGRVLREDLDAPLVLLGHSMGSFVVRAVLHEEGPRLAGCALSGVAAVPRWLAHLAASIAALEHWRLGPGTHSPWLRRLVFGRAERAFRPARTRFDWLSRDPEVVDAYCADPLCGFVLAPRSLQAMFGGLAELSRREPCAEIPRSLPIRIVAGSEDPIGGRKAVEALAGRYHRAGFSHVSSRIWWQSRHEVFNELNFAEVAHDLLDWVLHLPALEGQ